MYNTPLHRDEIMSYLSDIIGISYAVPVNKKAYRYDINNEQSFYIKSVTQAPEGKHPIVIHDIIGDELKRNPIPDVMIGELQASSAYQKFRIVKKNTNEPAGYEVDVLNTKALSNLLNRLGVNTLLHNGNITTDIERDLLQINAESSTERNAIIAARIGQGRFRESLMKKWDSSCAITGLSIPALLKASHIKPWKISTNLERLDVENGLLLSANLDAAFDAYLIAFSDDGKILLPDDTLSLELKKVLGINGNEKLRKIPSSRQRIYLKQHRTNSGIK
ncbi:HNH endonuclease [Acetobacter sicerae]|uniref:HNH endonuclease n=1 Tax=Acetobacter sicerae TaxID=85325 RepID=UPI00156B0AE2|nr:HNH endonuclease [Acetobacter sicerae]NHN90405.1 hypothetical protein [Acetobacter sicerae]